jgi:hypothetical protein
VWDFLLEEWGDESDNSELKKHETTDKEGRWSVALSLVKQLHLAG